MNRAVWFVTLGRSDVVSAQRKSLRLAQRGTSMRTSKRCSDWFSGGKGKLLILERQLDRWPLGITPVLSYDAPAPLVDAGILVTKDCGIGMNVSHVQMFNREVTADTTKKTWSLKRQNTKCTLRSLIGRCTSTRRSERTLTLLRDVIMTCNSSTT